MSVTSIFVPKHEKKEHLPVYSYLSVVLFGFAESKRERKNQVLRN